MRWRPSLGLFTLAALASAPAHATFYPFYSSAAHQRNPQPVEVTANPSVSAASPQVISAAPALQRALPANVVPTRYYAPAYGAPVPASDAAAPVASAPGYVAPAYPAAASVAAPAVIAPPVYAPPAYTPPPPAPAPAVVASPYAAPAYAYSNSPAPAARRTRDQFYVGIEGYYDRYQERAPSLIEDGGFGSITYGYTHGFDSHWFAGIDGRGSYGQSIYKSISGTIAAIPAYELDQRLTGGYDFVGSSGIHLRPFIGLGARYYSEEAKGEVTNSSPPRVGYDRRITQLYLPIGMGIANRLGSYSLQSSFEFDPLLWGYVESRFQNLGAPQASNHQSKGFGLRGEMLLGDVDAQGMGWQFGPFLRYWNIEDSKVADCDGPVAGNGFCLLEPQNNRLQTGLTARFLF